MSDKAATPASGLWDYDIEADALFCSAAWYAILGLDPSADRVDSVAQFRPHIHPDDVEAATRVDLDHVNELIERDERYHNAFRIVRPSGEMRNVRSVACIVRDDAAGTLRAIGCLTDVTEDIRPSHGEHGNRADSLPPSADIPRSGLSAREIECLSWVSVGKTAWETGAILGLSRRTVEFHLNNCIAKLGAANKVHAMAIAMRAGLI